MSTALYRLGRFAVRRRWVVLAAWLVVVVALFGFCRATGGELEDSFEIPGVESQQAYDLLEERFPDQAGARAQVVIHTDDGQLTDPELGSGAYRVLNSKDLQLAGSNPGGAKAKAKPGPKSRAKPGPGAPGRPPRKKST